MIPAKGLYGLKKDSDEFFRNSASKSSNAVFVCRPKEKYFETKYPPLFFSESGKRYSANASCWALVDRCVILDMLGYRLDLRRLSVAWEPMSSVGIAVRTIDPTSPVDRRGVVA